MWKEKILKKVKEFDNAAEEYLHKDRRGCGQIDNSGKETSLGGQGNFGGGGRQACLGHR